jgi:hypothetical protein
VYKRARRFTRERSKIVSLLLIVCTGVLLAWLMGITGLVGAVDKMQADNQLWFWPALLGSRWLMAAIWIVGDWLLVRQLSRKEWLLLWRLPHLHLPAERTRSTEFLDAVAIVGSLAVIAFFASDIFIRLVAGLPFRLP